MEGGYFLYEGGGPGDNGYSEGGITEDETTEDTRVALSDWLMDGLNNV